MIRNVPEAVGVIDRSILKWRSQHLRGACCSACGATGGHCGETGPPIGAPAQHTHKTFGALGDVQCDQDGNCYDSSTGELLSSPAEAAAGNPAYIMSGPNPTAQQIAAGMPSTVSSVSAWFSNNSATLVGLGALVGVLAFVSGRR